MAGPARGNDLLEERKITMEFIVLIVVILVFVLIVGAAGSKMGEHNEDDWNNF